MSDKGYAQHLARGGELLRADKIDDARAELEAAISLKPGDGKILNLLGLAYFRLARYDEAQAIYAELVNRHPDDGSMRLNLGLVHLKTGAVDEAIKELQKARDLEPKQVRTMGYLGLAYARKGKYALAREAFLAAGQDDLAREMEEQMRPTNGAAAAASATTPAPALAPEPVAEPEPEPIAKAPEKPAPPAVKAPAAHATPPPPPAAAIKAPPRRRADKVSDALPVLDAAEAGAVVEQLEPRIEPRNETRIEPRIEPSAPGLAGALAAARPRGASIIEPIPEAPAQPTALPTVTSFATDRLIRPDDGDQPFEIAAGDSLIVRVRGRVLSRTEGVIVSGGELAYEPATKRVRGRVTEEPFGSESRPMFIVTGKGHMVALPRGGSFMALQLVDDVMYVREDLVFAFEERLGWENGSVPGSAGGIPVVQFRGEGAVAVRARRKPLAVKLAPEKVLYIDATSLAGWIGRVIPRVVQPAAGGDASAPFVECSGEGVVLVEELERDGDGTPEKTG